MSNPTPKKPTAFSCAWWPKRYHNTNENLTHDDLLGRQEASELTSLLDQRTALAIRIQAITRGNASRSQTALEAGRSKARRRALFLDRLTAARLTQQPDNPEAIARVRSYLRESPAARRLCATRLQSLSRGALCRIGREAAEVIKLRDQQAMLAVRIQALHRGNSGRAKMTELHRQQAALAVRIQALHRGSSVRAEMTELHRQQAALAVRIQALHRGSSVRAGEAAELTKLHDQQAMLAVRIQALHRGNSARAEAAEGADRSQRPLWSVDAHSL